MTTRPDDEMEARRKEIEEFAIKVCAFYWSDVDEPEEHEAAVDSCIQVAHWVDSHPPAERARGMGTGDDERDAEAQAKRFYNELDEEFRPLVSAFVHFRKGFVPASEVDRMKTENLCLAASLDHRVSEAVKRERSSRR